MVIDRLEISYCEGWDPQARRAVGPVSRARAAARDQAGEQYAVMLHAHSIEDERLNGRPARSAG